MVLPLLTVLLLAPLATLHAAEIKGVETSQGLTILGRYVAVDNVCAWPNLTLLADGGTHHHPRSSERSYGEFLDRRSPKYNGRMCQFDTAPSAGYSFNNHLEEM